VPEDLLIAYLEEMEEKIVEEYRQRVIASEQAPFKDKIHLNGQAMYKMVIGYFRGTTTLEDIKELAFQMAGERNLAKVNIGDFVYNVCLGRKLIFELLLKSQFPPDVLLQAIDKAGDCFDVFLIHAVSHYTDLKNNDLKEKQMFIERSHKDKLTILGQMASSFVHEFRNPLTSIMGFSRLLKEDYPDLPYLDIILNELNQLNFRVSQFLLASRKGTVDQASETIHIEELIEEILGFLYPAIVNVNAEISCEIDPECVVTGNREELRQVIINIIANALDALQKVPVNKQIVIQAMQADGDSVIRIANNGDPIPPDLLPVIFEPFFTTKKGGTGIGLYVCKEIIERYNGTITCQSTEEQTSFTIRFHSQAAHTQKNRQ